MKLHAVLCLLALAGCATVPSLRSSDVEPVAGSGGPAGDARGVPEPVRMETPGGTFLVHPNNAGDFARLLAGEPTDKQYISITDVP
ncbi:hypothetical protein [Archangium sp.]|uniref:hypothetical protein n=1 Tax=Archangium sp. TaxID=1872627 RepID=UPI002D31F699|nr:hypothetical protein [Archangium sp.]HYO59029.1 hypothetical protein [Archangium sp.]